MTRAASIVAFVVLTIGALMTSFAVALAAGGGRVSVPLVVGLVVAATLGEVATIVGDDEEGERTFSVGTTAHIAAALLLPVAWAGLVALAGGLAGERARRAPLLQTAFNGSVAVSCTMGASLTVRWLHPSTAFDWPMYLAVGAAVLVYVPLNIGPVGAICSAAAGERWRPMSWLPPMDLLTFLMEGCLGTVLAILTRQAPVGLLFAAPLLLTIFLSQKRYRLLRRETRRTLRALVSVIDARDPATAAHSERVGDLAARIVDAAGLGQRVSRDARWAGRLHDLGKLSVEDAILFKNGPLDDNEWNIMRRHPAVSAELLEPLGLTRHLAPVVRFHHERFDGTGYYRVPGDRVPLISMILVIADSFDAMTTDRPYRSGMDIEDALDEILHGAGSQFHPEFARIFVAMMRGLPIPDLSDDLRPAAMASATRALKSLATSS